MDDVDNHRSCMALAMIEKQIRFLELVTNTLEHSLAVENCSEPTQEHAARLYVDGATQLEDIESRLTTAASRLITAYCHSGLADQSVRSTFKLRAREKDDRFGAITHRYGLALCLSLLAVYHLCMTTSSISDLASLWLLLLVAEVAFKPWGYAFGLMLLGAGLASPILQIARIKLGVDDNTFLEYLRTAIMVLTGWFAHF